MSRHRQLAAIMFTDIQGYTALMQKDEKHAFAIRKRHREIFNTLTEKFNGKILQYYGDGTLSIFDSAIDAVNCGMEMQLEFQKKPEIPVRVGIHTGDILFSDEEIIGDGVNVAARIESVAVPGSVFISDKVYDEIKNHTKIQTQSLKTYTFKNVEKPIEVYAISNEGLVIPDLNKTATENGKGRESNIDISLKTKKSIFWIKGIAAIAFITALIIVLYFVFQKPESGLITSIAILPLDDISEEAQQDYFSDGMTEALTAEISKIGSLRVISRTSVMQYKNTEKTVPEIARELKIDALVEGSVIRAGNKIRIVAQLIRVDPERHIWAQAYDRDIDDVLLLFSEVAEEIAAEIEIVITPKGKSQKNENLKVNPQALEAYLKGYHISHDKSEHGLTTGLNYLKSAVDLDSTFAKAYSMLAYTYLEIGNYGIKPLKEMYPLVIKAAEKALVLDNNQDVAHATLGRIKMVHDYDWEMAEREFKKALNINNNSVITMEWYADYLIAMGKYNEGLDLLKKSIDLDPFSASTILHLGEVYLMNGKYDLAIEEMNKALELDPNFFIGNILISGAYSGKGLYNEAKFYIDKANNIADGNSVVTFIPLGYLYAASGEREKALHVIEELKSLSEQYSASLFYIASLYAILDYNDEALLWLEKSYEERNINISKLNSYSVFDNLKSEPEFIDLKRKMGLL